MSLTIGPLKLQNAVFLAPMSGVSDLPFRRLVREFGAGLVFSEMIASRQMVRAHKETLRMSTGCHDEQPMAVQLAGCDPSVMAEAARMNEARGAALIDINMGCPAKKVVNGWAGSALMRQEDLAVRIVEAVVKAVSVPVTVKMRLGWDHHSLNAPTLAKRAVEAGAQMITVHGRTRQQMYKGAADWTRIRAVKDAVSVPVIGNGDVLGLPEAQTMLRESGADGVMIGRGTYGKPWQVGHVAQGLKTGVMPPPPGLGERKALLIRHYEALLSHYGVEKGYRIGRKHLAWSAEGLRGANAFRRAVNTETDPKQVLRLIEGLFQPAEPLACAA